MGQEWRAKQAWFTQDTPIISLACAHPAKFPDAVAKATSEHPDLPSHLSDLMSREERFDVLENHLSVIENHVTSKGVHHECRDHNP